MSQKTCSRLGSWARAVFHGVVVRSLGYGSESYCSRFNLANGQFDAVSNVRLHSFLQQVNQCIQQRSLRAVAPVFARAAFSVAEETVVDGLDKMAGASLAVGGSVNLNEILGLQILYLVREPVTVVVVAVARQPTLGMLFGGLVRLLCRDRIDVLVDSADVIRPHAKSLLGR